MEMSLSKLQAIVKDREDWCDSYVSVGLHRVRHSLMTEEQHKCELSESNILSGKAFYK